MRLKSTSSSPSKAKASVEVSATDANRKEERNPKFGSSPARRFDTTDAAAACLTPPPGKGSTTLAKAKRLIASRSKWIQSKKRKQQPSSASSVAVSASPGSAIAAAVAEEEERKIIHGIENMTVHPIKDFLVAEGTVTASADSLLLKNVHEVSMEPLQAVASNDQPCDYKLPLEYDIDEDERDGRLPPPLPPLAPRSCTPTLEQTEKYWKYCYGSSMVPVAGNTPGSWSASRVPPMKSCLSSQKRARVINNVTARTATPSFLTPSQSNKNGEDASITADSSLATPVPDDRPDARATVTRTPKSVKFGNVDAAEFDLDRPAVEFTPMATDVARAKYSIEKKSREEEDENEVNEETKRNAAILAEWDDAFDELDDDDMEDDSFIFGEEQENVGCNGTPSRAEKKKGRDGGTKTKDTTMRRKRSSTRRDRRSSSFFAKGSATLLAESMDGEENESPLGSKNGSLSPLRALEMEDSRDINVRFNDDPIDTSPIETSGLLTYDYQSPMVLNRESTSSNSSDRMCAASLRSLHAGALLSPNTSGSSMSDMSNDDIRVSLERNLENAFDSSTRIDPAGSPVADKDVLMIYLPLDHVAARLIMDDSKFEINRDIVVFLRNAVDRQCFSKGQFSLDPEFIDRIVNRAFDKSEVALSTVQDTFCLLKMEFEPPCGFSLIELLDDAMAASLAGISDYRRIAPRVTPGGDIPGSGCVQCESIASVIDNCIDEAECDCLEWELLVMEQMLVQLRGIEEKIDEQCTTLAECLRGNNFIGASGVEVRIPKIEEKRAHVDVSTQVEKLARELRILEYEVRAAESRAMIASALRDLHVQQKSLKRNAMTLVHCQEKCFMASDLVTFEPQVLSGDHVEIMYPNVFDNMSACVGWRLLECRGGSSIDETDSGDSNSEASERVLGLPSVTLVPSEFSVEASTPMGQLLRLLFRTTVDGDKSAFLLMLMEIVGLFKEKSHTDLPNAVLISSDLCARINMLQRDLVETEKEFGCKVDILSPTETEKKVGLHIPLHFAGRYHISLRFWYDPDDCGTLVRLIPNDVDLDVDIGETFVYEDQLSQRFKHLLRERVKINCNALILRTACRTVCDLMGVS